MRLSARSLFAFACVACLFPSCSCDQPPDVPCEGENCSESLCGDGVDDDGDGQTDCEDGDCVGQACGLERDCVSRRCEFGVCATTWWVGWPCRASAGVCDRTDLCEENNPECPEDRKVEAGTHCGSGLGRPCESNRTCDGVSDECPEVAYKPAGTLCRSASTTCDVPEYCTGSDADCPADAPAAFGTLCRPASGSCDVDDFCDGVNGQCPRDRVAPAGQECRAASGPCDEPDFCDGVQSSCANDARKKPGTVCRAASRECDLPEVCDGLDAECPAEAVSVAPAGTVCRAGTSACEAPEVCDGVGLDCPPPAQGVAPAGTVCRSKADVCDAEDVCDGTSLECGADVFLTSSSKCGADQVCAGGAPGCPAWRQENPRPSGGWYAVSARASDDVWVGGDWSKTAHWDGKAWTDLGTTMGSACAGRRIDSIWAVAPDEAWAADGGLLLRWDGKGWKQQLDSRVANFRGVWGSAKDDVWAVGDCVLAHFDGRQWAIMSAGISLWKVWGSGPDDVWAMGTGLLHWDGKSWTTPAALVDRGIEALHGTGRSDVWVAADGGEIFHFDGTSWTELHWDGFTGFRIENLWATDAEIYVITAGEELLAVDRTGAAWRTVTDVPVHAIAGTSSKDLWIVGEGRPQHGDGAIFQEKSPGTILDVTDLAVSPDSSTVWAAAGSKVLQGTPGGDWTKELALPAWLFAVNRLWASGADDLWVSGFVHATGADAAVLAHWNGAAWIGVSTPGTPTALAGTGPTNVWLVGLEGLAMRWDGAAWQGVETNITRDLYSVSVTAPDDVWAGSKDSTLMHWDGKAWTEATFSGGGEFVSVTARKGTAWVLARRSDDAELLSWDGAQFTRRASMTGRFSALSVRAEDDIWAFGSKNGKTALKRWNGSSWSDACVPDAGELFCSAGNAAGEIWTGGRGGTILHLGP